MTKCRELRVETMAGLFSLSSIRGRLTLIVLITILIVLFQVTFVNSAISDVEELQNTGNEYIEMDRQILVDLTNLRETMLRISTGQIDSFIYELLHEGALDKTKNLEDVEVFVESLNRLNDLFEMREQHLYEINPEGALLITTLLLGGENYIVGGEDNPIINTDTSGYLGTSPRMTYFDVSLRGERNLVQVASFVNQLNSARESHIYDSEGSALAKIVPFVDDITTIPLADKLSTIRNETLNRVNDLNATSYVNKTNYVTLFENTFNLITEYVQTLDIFGGIISAIDYNQPTNDIVNTALAETNETIHNIDTELNELYDNNFTQTIDEIELISSGLLNESDNFLTSETYTITELGSLADVTSGLFWRNVHKVFSDNIYIIGRLLPQQSYSVNINVEILNNDVRAENAIFEAEFNRVINQYQSDIDFIQFTSQLLLSIVTIITALTAYQLISNFSGTQKKYNQIRQGNLKIPPKKRYSSNELGEIDRGFDNMVSEVRRILTAITESSERMAGISEELAAGSEEASASVQDVASTVREFSSGASEQNLLLNRVSEKLQEHLKNIEETSTRINETSSFVLKVAKRTNILGLNASIEAAKAGKFGRGFGIVAREVRNLSNETKRSAVEIAELIESIETRIRNTVRDIQHEVNITKDVAENTAAGSEEASASTSEQVIMLSEISQTSNELSLLASELAELVNQFQV